MSTNAVITESHINADGTVTVLRLFIDDSGTEHDFAEGDSLEIFRSEDARDEYVAQLHAEGVDPRRIFIVDRYEHSAVHYSVAGTAPYPDRPFDVAPCGVFVLDRDGEGGAPLDGYTDAEGVHHSLVENVNVILDEYSSWCNGDVYGYVIETYPTEAHWETAEFEDESGTEVDSCWGFIGYEYALGQAREAAGIAEAVSA